MGNLLFDRATEHRFAIEFNRCLLTHLQMPHQILAKLARYLPTLMPAA
jgi:hypothetical protein